MTYGYNTELMWRRQSG